MRGLGAYCRRQNLVIVNEQRFRHLLKRTRLSLLVVGPRMTACKVAVDPPRSKYSPTAHPSRPLCHVAGTVHDAHNPAPPHPVAIVARTSASVRRRRRPLYTVAIAGHEHMTRLW